MKQSHPFLILLGAIVVIASLTIIEDKVKERFSYITEDPSSVLADTEDTSYDAYSDPSCTLAGIELHGELRTYFTPDPNSTQDVSSSEAIISRLMDANDAPNIQAILLEIDSYGGRPVAAEEIASVIRTKIDKPVIAMIRSAGASAAYWAAAPSDMIFASALSDVGGIGVTMSYVDEGKYNELQGYTYNEISSGRFKDSGDPQKPLTDEERALFQRDVNIMHEAFVDSVAKDRGIDRATVAALADGSTMLGTEALKQNLIDAIGSYNEVFDYFESTYETDANLCW